MSLNMDRLLAGGSARSQDRRRNRSRKSRGGRHGAGREAARFYDGYEFPMTPDQYLELSGALEDSAAARGTERTRLDKIKSNMPTFSRDAFISDAQKGWKTVHVYGHAREDYGEKGVAANWARIQSGRAGGGQNMRGDSIRDREYMDLPSNYASLNDWKSAHGGNWENVPNSAQYRWGPSKRQLLRTYKLPSDGINSLMESDAFNKGNFTYVANWANGNTLDMDTMARGQSPDHDEGAYSPLVKELDRTNDMLNTELGYAGDQAQAAYDVKKKAADAALSTGYNAIDTAEQTEKSSLNTANTKYTSSRDTGRKTLEDMARLNQ